MEERLIELLTSGDESNVLMAKAIIDANLKEYSHLPLEAYMRLKKTKKKILLSHEKTVFGSSRKIRQKIYKPSARSYDMYNALGAFRQIFFGTSLSIVFLSGMKTHVNKNKAIATQNKVRKLFNYGQE